jgi:hypothetical protein
MDGLQEVKVEMSTYPRTTENAYHLSQLQELEAAILEKMNGSSIAAYWGFRGKGNGRLVLYPAIGHNGVL